MVSLIKVVCNDAFVWCFFLNVQVGAWAKIDFNLIVSHPLIYSWPLFTLSEHTKRTDFVDETGYNKNNNFDNRQISHLFWVLKRTVSSKHFFWLHKT